jgi:hypothetical protein
VDLTATDELSGSGGWTRAVMIVARLALLVFLLWTLVSSRFPDRNPVAGDAPPKPVESHTSVTPHSEAQPHAG